MLDCHENSRHQSDKVSHIDGKRMQPSALFRNLALVLDLSQKLDSLFTGWSKYFEPFKVAEVVLDDEEQQSWKHVFDKCRERYRVGACNSHEAIVFG